MHSGPGQRRFPLFPLLGAGALVLVSLISVAAVRVFGEPAPTAAALDPVIAARELRFTDGADGRVEVADASSGQEIRRLQAGEDGFVRATLRGLVRARRARGAGQTVPFRLELRQSGQLLLLDPVTGQAVDLWAFGTTNAQAFASMLDLSSRQVAGALETVGPLETELYRSENHAR